VLVEKYANVLEKRIPIEGIDGVSLNLKVPGKNPTVIVNTNISKRRQTFTLAHELGHIIIPWHLGTIVDNIYPQSYKDYEYELIEQEANRFAAELLMPSDWVLKKYSENNNLSSLHHQIISECRVSDHAAAIKIIDLLPKDIVYCAVLDNIVLHSGHTESTNAFLQEVNSKFNADFYPYLDEYYPITFKHTTYHWWKLSSKVNIQSNGDDRAWQDILNGIVSDLKIDDPKRFKQSINGIIANANGKIKDEGNYNVETVSAAAIYRFRRDELTHFTAHKDFQSYVLKKVEAMVLKKKV
jgi:Zn-dependent peptidase ImmA (M78 family)